MRALLRLLLGAALAIAIVGCGGGETKPQPPAGGGGKPISTSGETSPGIAPSKPM